MSTVFAGATFGAGLTASGVYLPSVIVTQLTLDNWHMIQTFLTATASSALLVSAAYGFEQLYLRPKSASSLGIFGRYDGNIIGGSLLGAGMALSGACPGTVLAQVAVGIRSGLFALCGAAVGGIVWSAVLQLMVDQSKPSPEPDEKSSLNEALGIGRGSVVIAFEIVCAAVVAATVLLTRSYSDGPIHPILGGLIIGAAQLISLILRKSLVGVSTCYQEAGDWFWWSIRGVEKEAPRRTAILFSAGLISGAWAISKAVPGIVKPNTLSVSPVLALVGGFLVALGSRIAGGCTSGHGISGISLLSTSSFITIGSAFVVGIAAAKVLYQEDSQSG